MKVMFFPNGNTACFENGRQVPELQESWFMLYVQLLAAIGHDPTQIEFTMPNGMRAKVFELEDGSYNWGFGGNDGT